ncbi:hypothetical protein YC2023_104794 [Brassica napus]
MGVKYTSSEKYSVVQTSIRKKPVCVHSEARQASRASLGDGPCHGADRRYFGGGAHRGGEAWSTSLFNYVLRITLVAKHVGLSISLFPR